VPLALRHIAMIALPLRLRSHDHFCAEWVAFEGATFLISPSQTAAMVEMCMISVLPQTEHFHRKANGETAAAQSQLASGCFIVAPLYHAVGLGDRKGRERGTFPAHS
jgi:hypothetical protein